MKAIPSDRGSGDVPTEPDAVQATKFNVQCPNYGKLCGEYSIVNKNRYRQDCGDHVLVRHPKGFWGIGDGQVFAAITDEITTTPASVKQWKILRLSKYQYEPRMTVKMSSLASKTGADIAISKKEFVVSCSSLPQLDGKYESSDGGAEYKQNGGTHLLAKNDEGRWGFVNTINFEYMALSGRPERVPSSVTSWKRLRDGTYSLPVDISVTLVGDVGKQSTSSLEASAVPVGEELDVYHVLVPQRPGLTGTYVLDPATSRYQLPGGKAWLEQGEPPSGRWTLSTGKGVQATSYDHTIASTASALPLWKVKLPSRVMTPCRYMQVRRTPALTPEELQLVDIVAKLITLDEKTPCEVRGCGKQYDGIYEFSRLDLAFRNYVLEVRLHVSGGKISWVLVDAGMVLCRNTCSTTGGVTHIPPSHGWKSVSTKVKAASEMTVITRSLAGEVLSGGGVASVDKVPTVPALPPPPSGTIVIAKAQSLESSVPVDSKEHDGDKTPCLPPPPAGDGTELKEVVSPPMVGEEMWDPVAMPSYEECPELYDPVYVENYSGDV